MAGECLRHIWQPVQAVHVCILTYARRRVASSVPPREYESSEEVVQAPQRHCRGTAEAPQRHRVHDSPAIRRGGSIPPRRAPAPRPPHRGRRARARPTAPRCPPAPSLRPAGPSLGLDHRRQCGWRVWTGSRDKPQAHFGVQAARALRSGPENSPEHADLASAAASGRVGCSELEAFRPCCQAVTKQPLQGGVAAARRCRAPSAELQSEVQSAERRRRSLDSLLATIAAPPALVVVVLVVFLLPLFFFFLLLLFLPGGFLLLLLLRRRRRPRRACRRRVLLPVHRPARPSRPALPML